MKAQHAYLLFSNHLPTVGTPLCRNIRSRVKQNPLFLAGNVMQTEIFGFFWAVMQRWKVAGCRIIENCYWFHLHKLNDQRIMPRQVGGEWLYSDW